MALKEIIKKYNLDGIWHFTDGANFPAIERNGGLLCYAELKRRGISIPAPGGNDWSHEADERVGVDEYVHLAFIPNHPMLFRAKDESRIAQPRWLKIDISILDVEGVRFTREVSNKSGATLLTPEEANRPLKKT